jgi:hypothetical protein
MGVQAKPCNPFIAADVRSLFGTRVKDFARVGIGESRRALLGEPASRPQGFSTTLPMTLRPAMSFNARAASASG